MDINIILLAVNYDEIVNYIYDNDDFITDKIINYYKNYVLSIMPNDKQAIKRLDMIVKNYISDRDFNSYVKVNLNDDTDYYYDLDITLTKLYKDYLLREKRKLSMHRWL